MRSKQLVAYTLMVLPTLAYASAADYFQEEPLSENTGISGREINNDTEVLTPQGILSEDTFDATHTLGAAGINPFDGPAAAIPGDISPAAGPPSSMNPLYQPEVEGAPSGTPGPATTIAAPPLDDTSTYNPATAPTDTTPQQPDPTTPGTQTPEIPTDPVTPVTQ